MNEKMWKAILSFFIYFCVVILMVEWLKPVIELTNTGHLKLFCLFIVLSFLFYFLKWNWKITIPLKILLISWFLIFIYTDFSFWSKESFVYLMDTILDNSQAFVSQEWMEVTNTFRTLLFFILLWMTTYLLNYWIQVRRNLLLFFLLTFLFIAILDTFSPYSSEKSIAIILVTGFFTIGLLNAQKVLDENKVKIKGPFLLSASLYLFGFIFLSTALAYALPKADPSWPDPVPFFTSSKPASSEDGEREGTGGIRKVGYGENDEKLGGAFIGDNTPVFYATVPDKQYWKIETKDTYTSKGWVQSETAAQISNYDMGDPIVTDFVPGQADDAEIASISMMEEYAFVMQPYGLLKLDTAESVTLSLNATNQQVTTFLGGNTVPLKKYEILYSEPVYSLNELRETTNTSLNELTSEYDRYLQLPDSVPTRVKELAVSISEKEDSLYEKAKMIERSFRLGGFRYDQKSAAIPEGDTDYVDQFLFETKTGYCDNFSTSMVVMLRSLGIPARWVKGFAAGEIIRSENGVPIYEVTNNNAHSWVEAYLPNIGWMQFEPTIGFSNSVDLNYDLDFETYEQNTPKPIIPKDPEKEETKKERTEVSKGFTDALSGIAEWVSTHKAMIVWSIIGVFVMSLLGYHFRRKWISKVLIPVYRMRKNDWGTFEKMYLQLLKQLSLYGVGKEQGETLMDYAKRIDGDFGGNHMRKLTNAYEKGFYGGKQEAINFVSMRESWENLINQLSG